MGHGVKRLVIWGKEADHMGHGVKRLVIWDMG